MREFIMLLGGAAATLKMLNILDRLKIFTASETPPLCPFMDVTAAPGAEAAEKRGVEMVGGGCACCHIGWHASCVCAKSERFEPDVRHTAAGQRPRSDAIRME